MRTTVMVVDGGGRGSALVDLYARSPHVVRVLSVPGNDWMAINSDIAVSTFPHLQTTSVKEIVALCQEEDVGLVDVANDRAVAVGLVDSLRQRGIPAVGPTRKAGQIEWDKAWARSFMSRHGITQPEFTVFDSPEEGKRYLRDRPDGCWFVKASGLAGGKGALPAVDNQEAAERIDQLTQFGEAGRQYLVEEWAVGEEFSTFIITDGQQFRILGSAQDHKRLDNFDQGPNTGGMGCSSAPLVLTQALMGKVEHDILIPTVQGLRMEGRAYQGVLYLGGIVLNDGTVSVIEYNARWGDPELQVFAPGFVGDFFEANLAMAEGNLGQSKLSSDGLTRVVVSGVARGYPGDYSAVLGKRVFGLADAQAVQGVKVYGAGVQRIDGQDIAAGGRLFHVVGEGQNVIEARNRAYNAISMMSVEDNNLHYRIDIGWRDVERLRSVK